MINQNDYDLLSVGEACEKFVGLPEGISAALTESGIHVLITFQKPSMQEIESVRSDKIQFRLVVQNDIPIFLVKFDRMDWMEAPICVDDRQVSCILDMSDETMGYGAYIILADCESGIVCSLRAVGLGNNFSKKFNEYLLRAPQFSRNEYVSRVVMIQNKYTTKELVSMTNVYYNSGTLETL